MIAFRKYFIRLLAFAAFGASLTVMSSSPLLAAPVAPNEMKQDWLKHRQEWFKNRTDKMADRLEIKASQQGAWQAYVKTLEAVMERPVKKPEGKSDAASIARARADMAAVRAQKFAQIADATAKLQEVLGPDQRKTLDQIVAHAGRHGHRFHGMHGDHGDQHGHWDQQEAGHRFGEDRGHEQH